jgi:hypothetical protein
MTNLFWKSENVVPFPQQIAASHCPGKSILDSSVAGLIRPLLAGFD